MRYVNMQIYSHYFLYFCATETACEIRQTFNAIQKIFYSKDEEAYPEEPIEDADYHEHEQSSTTTTTTEAPKKMIRPSVRPMRSNEDLLSALKKRRISEKNKPKEGKLIDISLLTFPVIENLACVKCKLECLFGYLNLKLNNSIVSFAFKTIMEFRFNKDAVNIVAHSCSDFEFSFFLAVNTGFTISQMT